MCLCFAIFNLISRKSCVRFQLKFKSACKTSDRKQALRSSVFLAETYWDIQSLFAKKSLWRVSYQISWKFWGMEKQIKYFQSNFQHNNHKHPQRWHLAAQILYGPDPTFWLMWEIDGKCRTKFNPSLKQFPGSWWPSNETLAWDKAFLPLALISVSTGALVGNYSVTEMTGN